MRLSYVIVALGLSAIGAGAQSQVSLASRVARAPDGIVHLQYPARSGVCGDGRDVIGVRNALFAHNFQSYGRWSGVKCVAGPVRVALTVADGRVVRAQTFVGGSWSSTTERVTDLGDVAPHDATLYFVSLVPTLEASTGKDRLLLPAVVGDDDDVMPSLLQLARDDARSVRTRRQAVQWIGLLGDARVLPVLVGFARQPGQDDDDNSKSGIGNGAIAALSMLENGVGIPPLIELSRTGSVGTRRNAAFWLGQSGDPRGLRRLHQMIEDDKEESQVRSHAIFALSHNGETPDAEFDYLRSVYPRLNDEKLKEAIIQGMAEDKETGGRWLIARAKDTRESLSVRKNALFWAGQRDVTSIAEIVTVYRDAAERSLREHAIFVLSQRHDDDAVDALLRIARDDTDKDMRGKAMFWLAQKRDPRVTKMISDILVK